MTRESLPPMNARAIGTEDTLAGIRAAVLDRILWVIVPIGGAATIAASVEAVASKDYVLVAFYLPIYAVVVASFAVRRIPYALRASVPLVATYAVGMSELWYFGLSSQGFLYLFAFVTFSGTFFRLRAALAALALSLISIVSVASLYCNNLVPMNFAVQEVSTHLHNWITATMSFVMLSACSNALLSLIFRGFERSVRSSDEYLAELRREVVEREKAEQQFRTVVEASKDAMVAIDHKGEVFLFNPAAERMFRTAAAHVLGRPPDTLIPQELRGRHSAFVAKYFLGEGSRRATGETLELTAVRGNGETFPIELSLSAGSLGEEPFVLAMIRDISERKRAEEEKAKLEAQLLHAQKMEAIGTLAGGIAHDFNNILSAIVGYSELALNDIPDDSSARKSIAEVLLAGKRATDLVRQILTFSRQTVYEPKPIRLQTVVKEGLRMLREALPATVSFRQDINSDCPAVLADATQIHQVLINLCTNASHAMEDLGGTLFVKLEPVSVTQEQAGANLDLKPGRHCCLTVEDSGKGMDETTLERVFEPFFTTKEEGKGTGLGLATVHGIVKSHGGAILVESAPGRGTRFKVFFPVVEEHGEEILKERETPPPGCGEHILLVDDERAIVEVCTRTLTGIGYRVSEFLHAEEALEAFQSTPDGFDALITDRTMPKMTGINLAEAVLARKSDLPIILITGTGNPAHIQEARDAGIHRVLPKPLDMVELARTLRRLLDGLEA